MSGWIPDAENSNMPPFDIALTQGQNPEEVAQQLVSKGWIPDTSVKKGWIADESYSLLPGEMQGTDPRALREAKGALLTGMFAQIPAGISMLSPWGGTLEQRAKTGEQAASAFSYHPESTEAQGIVSEAGQALYAPFELAGNIAALPATGQASPPEVGLPLDEQPTIGEYVPYLEPTLNVLGQAAAMGIRPRGGANVIESEISKFRNPEIARAKLEASAPHLKDSIINELGREGIIDPKDKATIDEANAFFDEVATGTKPDEVATGTKPAEVATGTQPAEVATEQTNLAGTPGERVTGTETIPTEGNIPVEETTRTTGIKNAVTEAERAARGLEPVEAATRDIPFLDEAKQLVDSGERDPRVLADEVAKNPRPLSDVENGILTYDRMRLYNEETKVMDNIEKARTAGDIAAEMENKTRLETVREAILKNDEAAKLSGTEWGRSGKARQILIREDYSIDRTMQRARVASPDGKVSAELRVKLESLTKQLEEAGKKIKDYEDKAGQEQARKVVDNIIKEEQLQKRRVERAQTKGELKTEFDTLIQDLNRKIAGLHANPMLDPETIGIIGKMARNRIKAGIVKLEDIVDNIHTSIRDLGFDKDMIRQALAEHAKVTGTTRDEIVRELKEARRLQGYKTRTTNRIAELEQKLATGDFTKKTRQPLVLDQQATNLKAQYEKLKVNIEDAIRRQEFQNRTPTEKALYYIAKWRRAVILSSVTTLGKLTSAAWQRLGITPIEELVGGVLSKMPGISKIAAKAPREGGGLNIAAEAKAFRQMVEKATFADIKETAKTGKGSLDYLYGKKGGLPPEALDFFGHLHGVLKVMPKRAEFFRSLEKRTQWALKNGLDITDPTTQTTLCADAYIDANRAILMQDNIANTGYRMLLGYFQSKGLIGKATATTMQVLLPIVKVPMNFVSETFNYAAGSAKGGLQVIYTLIRKDALKNLEPNQADNIMRSLKKGSIGLALLGIGFYAPDIFGGFYRRGEKRKESEIEAGGVLIAGVKVPHWLLHSPPIEVLQMGATIRRVYEGYGGVKADRGSLSAGALAAVGGTMQRVPFLEEPARVSEAMKSSDKASLFGAELGASMVIPPDIRRLAEVTDTSSRPRKAKTAAQVFEKQIPGLREKVPFRK